MTIPTIAPAPIDTDVPSERGISVLGLAGSITAMVR